MNQSIKRKNTNVYSKLVGFFLFLTIIAIFVVLHFALAKVKIKIYNNLEEKQSSVLVEVQAENSEDLSPDALIGKILKTEFEIETSVPSSQDVVSTNRAGGFVTIYNNYSRNQVLIATTRLLTPDDKLFRISERVEIAPGSQAQVWAEADQEGENFITEATTFTIPGLWEGLQEYIYAESKDGMKMQTRPGFSVSQENLNELDQKIKELAMAQALETFNAPLSDNLKINSENVSLEFEIIEASQLGASSQETSAKLKVKASAVVFDKNALTKIAEEKLSKELDNGESLVELDKESINYNILEINEEKQEAILELKLTATVNTSQTVWDINKDELVGLNEAALQNYFKELNIEEVEINFSPFWVKSVPKLKDHIIIE